MQTLLTMLLLVSMVNCGVDELSARLSSVQGNFGNEVRPPMDYYRALLTARVNDNITSNASYGKVFLNFGGGEIFRGFGKNQSFIPCDTSVVISPAVLTIEEQESIFDEARNLFNTEDVPLALVLDEPLTGDYSTVHIGGWYHSLGCRGQAVLGTAPSDHGNVNPADVGFVFNNERELLPRAIAHVVGRMSGLPLQNQANNIMGRHISAHTPLVLSEQERQILRNQHSTAARIAGDDLPGEIFISAISTTLGELDADEVLDITPLQGELRVLVPAAVKLPALARALSAIHALGLDREDFNKKSGKWGKIKSALGKVLKKTLIKSVQKPRDVRANVSSSIADVLGDAWQKNKKTQARRLRRLPNLTSLLELDALTESAQLFPMLQAHRQLLNHQHGTEHDSMLSLLKVGYFQRLAEMP